MPRIRIETADCCKCYLDARQMVQIYLEKMAESGWNTNEEEDLYDWLHSVARDHGYRHDHACGWWRKIR